jgi:hypothetical protein
MVNLGDGLLLLYQHYLDLLNDLSDRVTGNALRSTWAPPLSSEISRLAVGCGEAANRMKIIHLGSIDHG